MKSELGYIFQEPQIILQRAACGSRATIWPPLEYYMLDGRFNFRFLHCMLIIFIMMENIYITSKQWRGFQNRGHIWEHIVHYHELLVLNKSYSSGGLLTVNLLKGNSLSP